MERRHVAVRAERSAHVEGGDVAHVATMHDLGVGLELLAFKVF